MDKELKAILAHCPNCTGDLDDSLYCATCGFEGKVQDGVLDLVRERPNDGPHVAYYNDPEYKHALQSMAKIHKAHYSQSSLSSLLEKQFKLSLLTLFKPQGDADSEVILDIGCGAGSSYKVLHPLGKYFIHWESIWGLILIVLS